MIFFQDFDISSYSNLIFQEFYVFFTNYIFYVIIWWLSYFSHPFAIFFVVFQDFHFSYSFFFIFFWFSDRDFIYYLLLFPDFLIFLIPSIFSYVSYYWKDIFILLRLQDFDIFVILWRLSYPFLFHSKKTKIQKSWKNKKNISFVKNYTNLENLSKLYKSFKNTCENF